MISFLLVVIKYIKSYQPYLVTEYGLKRLERSEIQEDRNMIRVLMSGCNGKMGRMITEIAKQDQDVEIVAGVD